MTGSYNETLSTTFAKAVRNSIQEEKADMYIPTFSDVFPSVRVKRGDASMSLWSLEGGYNNYLATSPTGTATGFGATCFPKGTMIHTDKGIMDIEDIHNDRNGIRALTLNHKNDIIRYNEIKVTRRLISNEIIEITTNTGRKIKSTADHRYYTEEYGYIEARQLEAGYTVKTCEIQRDLQTMRTAKKRYRRTLQGVLRQEQNNTHRFNLFTLWERISSIKVRIRESFKTWLQRKLLLKGLFVQDECGEPKRKQMRCMWGIYKIWEKVLFTKMQSNRHENSKETKRHKMPYMWRYIQTKLTHNKVLFNEMQEQSTFFKDGWRGKLTLQRWNALQEKVFRIKTIGKAKGQLHLSTMRSFRRNAARKKTWTKNKLSSTSQGLKQSKQYNEQFNNSMCKLSRYTTSHEKIVSIKYLDEKVPVYDLQVDKDENFFANGVLVHNCMIIDDLIKNDLEAYNEKVLEGHWSWFTNTMLSRLEEGGKIIIIMTRWASGDLAGRALEHFKEQGITVKHVNVKALQDDGTMLCDEVLSKSSYAMKVAAMGEDIASANYQQEPIDLKGCLYTRFKTYEEVPKDDKGNILFTRISSYCDTADEGSDYLANIVYGEYNKEAYVLDVYYTKEPMEVTEEGTAKMLYENSVNVATIESNNGGRGFARSVERILKEKYMSNKTRIKWFHQSKNKVARILSGSTWVMDHIYYPVNWRDRWPEYYKAMTKYQREGKNAHDDAIDATTGVGELMNKGNGLSVFK